MDLQSDLLINGCRTDDEFINGCHTDDELFLDEPHFWLDEFDCFRITHIEIVKFHTSHNLHKSNSFKHKLFCT